MNTFDSFAIIILAALIQASFQLSISILTLMSGHALGRKTRHSRLLGLLGGFIFGVAIITALLLSFIAVLFSALIDGGSIPPYIWAGLSGIAIGVGVAVWVFYYKRAGGTALWVPRAMANYLSARAKVTKSRAESFGLGMTSVVGELLFCIAPLMIAALVLLNLDPLHQLLGIAVYTIISILPLLIITLLLGGGHTISTIQRWREHNKSFLQFTAGSALIVLGVYLYVDAIITSIPLTGVGS